MDGKSRIAVSEIVRVLVDKGAASKATAYKWVEESGIGRVVEDGSQKYWEGDFARLFEWVNTRLGKKEVVREIVEQGIPFKEYQKALEEIRRLEREVVERKAEVRIREEKIKSLEKRIGELLEEKVKLAQSLEARERELQEAKGRIRTLEFENRLKELQPFLEKLGEKERKEFVKKLEELLNGGE